MLLIYPKQSEPSVRHWIYEGLQLCLACHIEASVAILQAVEEL